MCNFFLLLVRKFQLKESNDFHGKFTIPEHKSKKKISGIESLLFKIIYRFFMQLNKLNGLLEELYSKAS